MKRSKYFLVSAIICFVILSIGCLGLLLYDSKNSLLAFLVIVFGMGELVFGFMALIEALME